MKLFMIKFYALMAIILGVIGYYARFVQPELSGDMGRIGQIPFGMEYEQKIKAPYDNFDLLVHTIHQSELINDSIITIGDSFSQYGKYGYSQFVANELDCHVTNIAMTDEARPEQLFIRLVNNNRIPHNAIVIVESVERNMIRRLSSLNFNDSKLILNKQNVLEVDNQPKVDMLDEMVMWLRSVLGFKQTIFKYSTDRDLFSHVTRKNELYIYDSQWDNEGDLRFIHNLRTDMINIAYNNLLLLHQFAEKNNIHLIYLVAADKYDVYEPFIVEKHEKNPTLDSLPKEDWIVNSKAILQAKAYEGAQDLYYINDTHWSPIGAQIIGEEIVERVQIVQ